MSKLQQLSELKQQVSECKKCALSATRTNTVFGEGNPDAEIMFIGEGPGRDEDLSGRPFVGRAGELLTRIIEKGINVPRSEVFIANIVKCRPSIDGLMKQDRPPSPQETEACCGYILKQIEIIKPKVIITLGNPATKFILKTQEGITKTRGNFGDFNGIPVMPTFHPSYVIRNGGDKSPLKKDVWEDIKKVLLYLGKEIPGKR